MILEAIAGFAIRGCETDFGIYPILRVQYRYYYSMERRFRKGKNSSGNSGNYIAALVGYEHDSPIIGDLNTVNILVSGRHTAYNVPIERDSSIG